MKKCLRMAAFVMVAAGLSASQFTAGSGGKLALQTPALQLQPAFYDHAWGYKTGEYDVEQATVGNKYVFTMNPYGKNELDGFATFSLEAGRIKAAYEFTAKAEVSLNSLFVGATLDLKSFAGGSWKTADGSGIFPKHYKDMSLMREKTTTCTLTTAAGDTSVTFEFPAETEVLIQDNRQWSENYTLRIGYLTNLKLKQGEQRQIHFTVTTPEQPQLRQQHPVILQAGEEWIPMNVKLDILSGSALDLSQQGFTDAPAGKHGRLIAKESHFVFEGTPDQSQRFYGVNFCFSANYLEDEVAGKVAERLARIGYNSIRIHHHDAQMTAGSEDGATLNAEEMRKFDNFTAACIKQGLYLSTDLFVSRKVPWKAVGVDKPGTIPMDQFKMLVPVHEGAYNNLRQYTINWLSHVNPHTGRSYAKEPALAWINIINEGNFGNKYSELKQLPEWAQAWRQWLAAKKAADPASYGAIPEALPSDLDMRQVNPHQAAFILFMRDLEIKMIRRFRKLLHEELGCHALISNANGWAHFVPDQYVRDQTYDYVDEHFYVDHPRWIKQSWRLPSYCPNTNPIKNKNSGGRQEIYIRLFNKPFTITEYNYSAPGRFRGVGGILTGALAALQEWDGLWRFSYSHNGDAINSMVSQKLNYFDMLCDPLSLAAERASICLFLRTDLKPLQETALVFLPEDKTDSVNQIYPRTKNLWASLGWSHKTGTLVGSRIPEGFDHVAQFPEVYAQYNADPSVIPFIGATTEELIKRNQNLAIDNESGTFVITTERTCGGFTEKGAINAGVLAFDVGESAATVWISSLDKNPIATSHRLLLTHLTDIQNTGIKYAEDERQTLLNWGDLPHLARAGTAKISLALAQPEQYKVYALETNGARAGEIPVTLVKGRLCFDAKTATFKNSATIVYEIVRKL
ncbi:MAG: hypothetical protein PHO37_01115 [Kiritimatiellae bacterium]|nr:hypothetical protein [Kiritimatiellia bacterium]